MTIPITYDTDQRVLRGGGLSARASTTTPEKVLSFADVGKTYPDGTTALMHVDLAIHRGDFVTVVGPSGCGKSTLLRIASGLEPHTSGTCEVDSKHLGYVFQDATLLPWRTVQQNVELVAELSGRPKNDRKAAAKSAIELVGLTGFEQHLPRQLSGGMKMRVSLARSLTLAPDLFLFDEPFGALDEITRERLNDELIRLFSSQRFGALFITHSVSEAVYLSNKVVVMSGRPGKVVAAFDVPFDYPRSPELRFTPEFAALSGQASAALREGHS
ncbi:MAG: transporter ATP-binding protein [Pseudonocardia sp.]|jgi:NitT/TauT family transport system ATP-binding protein|nr:transporter ATP-binding protein [Pseudonocardia sp.]